MKFPHFGSYVFFPFMVFIIVFGVMKFNVEINKSKTEKGEEGGLNGETKENSQ